LINDAIEGNEHIGLVVSKSPEDENPSPKQIYPIGVVAKIHRTMRGKDGNLQIVVQGMQRFEIIKWTQVDPYLKALVKQSDDIIEEDKLVEIEALRRRMIELVGEIIKFMPQVPDEVTNFLETTEDPRVLLYTVAHNMKMEHDERLNILMENNLRTKMRQLLQIMAKEVEVLEISEKIQSDTQEELDKVQREYYLRQQLKSIQKELGEADEVEVEVEKYLKKFEEIGLPEEAKKEAIRELNRLKKLPPQSAEYGIIKTYLDWITELPWNVLTQDNLDIEHAKTIFSRPSRGFYSSFCGAAWRGQNQFRTKYLACIRP